MTQIIRNLTRINQWGRTYYYFDAPNKRDDLGPISYAYGKKWRIVSSWESGLGNSWVTYKCEPITQAVKTKSFAWGHENDK